MIIEEHIPLALDGNGPVNLGPANLLGKAELDVWIPFFLKHQKKKIPWKDGLIFKPKATVSAADVFGGEFARQ
jgi:hypothetical protein